MTSTPPSSDADITRLRQLVQDGDRLAWSSLARASARRNEPLDLAWAVLPWDSKQDVVDACIEALREGCALSVGQYLVKPYQSDQWRGVECWLDGRLRERWWGGVGSEEQAAFWLYDQWLGRERIQPL
jgi:hypothetical protein